MLSKRCPFTGIINFYSDVDPHFAVGSIALGAVPSAEKRGHDRSGSDKAFTWRCYTDDGTSAGTAPDFQTAERRLVNFLALVDAPQHRVAIRVA